jgi:ferrous iron transport protein A
MYGVSLKDKSCEKDIGMTKRRNTSGQKGVFNGELPLNSAPCGCGLRITHLYGKAEENCRLCALGLTPGTRVQVLSCDADVMRLSVRGYNLALDAGLARLALCELADTK